MSGLTRFFAFLGDGDHTRGDTIRGPLGALDSACRLRVSVRAPGATPQGPPGEAGNAKGDRRVVIVGRMERQANLAEGFEVTKMVCDYNGWNDAPEDEREALDLVEPTLYPASLAVLPSSQPGHFPAPAVEASPHRRAA